MWRDIRRVSFLVAGMVLVSGISAALAEDERDPRKAQRATVYTPVYSHIYFGDALKAFNLAVTVAIRNPDMSESIEVRSVDYYNTSGKLVRSMLPTPVTVAPLGSYYVKIRESDSEGGAGASVLVRWEAQRPVVTPIIESVMIGAASGQGISFVSRGKIVAE